MSLEVFEKLESKVQQAIDTITLLQMEIEELKEKNNTLVQEVQSAQHGREELERENSQLKEQQHRCLTLQRSVAFRIHRRIPYSFRCRTAIRRNH